MYRFSKTLLLLLTAFTSLVSALNATKLYSFPLGQWAENINVRSNGAVLISLVTAPELYQIDPFTLQNGLLLHRFYGYEALTAIVEMQEDVFYVVAGNVSLTSFPAEKGSWSIWEVDLRGVGTNEGISNCQIAGSNKQRCGPVVTKVADVSSATFLDGMDALNVAKGLLITGDADSTSGQLYTINVQNGEVKKTFNSTQLGDPLHGSVGINGIKYVDGSLYFTNGAHADFGRVAVNADNGEATGPVEILIELGVAVIDDFILSSAGDLFGAVSEGGIGFARGPLNCGKNITIIASDLPGPTATRFGRMPRDRDVLYVTSTGGEEQFATGNYTSEAGLWKVNVASLMR